MATEYSGGGDPKRSIELLWRTQEPPKRGPKPRLTVDQIAGVAIDLADREGLAGLSMRRVADHLGVTAMSLYTYVPGKAELIDLMLDTVYAEVVGSDAADMADMADSKNGWRARLELIARQNWDLYRRHPWLLQVATSRPALGPNVLAKYDYELGAVTGLGLTEIEMDLLLSLVLDYVHGAVRGAVHAVQVEQRTGMTDEQWWQIAAPLLDKVIDPTGYPTAARVGTAATTEYGAAYAPVRAFEFGLQRMLDGIEAFIQSRREPGREPDR
jgi:AcrR family transcriptional regulator